MTTISESSSFVKSLESFFHEYPDLILSLDKNGVIQYTNCTKTSFLGYTSEDLKNQSLRNFFLDSLEKEKTSQKTFECRFKTKDGQVIPVEVRSFSVQNPETPRFCVLRDLRPLTDIRNNFFETGRHIARNELAPSLIHDIRNSLSVLSAQHYFMKHNAEKLDTEKFLSGLDIIQKAGSKIEKIINQLRDVIQREEEVISINLRELMETCIFLVEPQTRKHSVIIHNKIPLELTLTCVPVQIEQVCFHILSNAIQACETRPEKTINIDASQVQDSIILNFKDTGVGMEESILDKIFDPFFTTKPKDQYMGLGLYVSRQLLLRHGGSIKAVSDKTGSTFTITLPKD